jgi:hypothetical protein
MKSYPRVRLAAIAGLVLVGLLASSSAFATECWIICKCRAQCSTPCSDVGEMITCGFYGLCECTPAVATPKAPKGLVESSTTLSTSTTPDPLATIFGNACPALPAPSPAAAVGR